MPALLPLVSISLARVRVGPEAPAQARSSTAPGRSWPGVAAGAVLLTALALAPVPALASTSASSASSDGVSASVGGTSTSIEKSSQSSAGDKKVAQGAYRVTRVEPVAGRPGLLRLALTPLEPAHEAFALVLPQAAFDAGRLAEGQVVEAAAREYGLAFLRADTREAFFLVLDDGWQRGLQNRPVVAG